MLPIQITPPTYSGNGGNADDLMAIGGVIWLALDGGSSTILLINIGLYKVGLSWLIAVNFAKTSNLKKVRK